MGENEVSEVPVCRGQESLTLENCRKNLFLSFSRECSVSRREVLLGCQGLVEQVSVIKCNNNSMRFLSAYSIVWSTQPGVKRNVLLFQILS